MSISERAVLWAIDIANDDSHGYDQSNRWGTDYDCSSLVISAYIRAGVPLSCTYTGNMRGDMLAHGFALVTDGTLQRGDVLLNEKSHTALYIGDGMIVQASSNELGGITGGVPGDQSGREISIRSYYNFPWDCVLRYKEESPKTVSDSYEVKRGDTLIGISSRTGVPVTELIKINRIVNPNLIKVGQILRLRGDEESGETDSDSHGNNSSDGTGEVLPAEHEVKRGDNLWSICVKYYGSGTLDTINALKDKNGLLSDTIYPGMILKL